MVMAQSLHWQSYPGSNWTDMKQKWIFKVIYIARHAPMNSTHRTQWKDWDTGKGSPNWYVATVHILCQERNNILTLLTGHMKEVCRVGITTAVNGDLKHIFELSTRQQNTVDVFILINKLRNNRSCQCACWKERPVYIFYCHVLCYQKQSLATVKKVRWQKEDRLLCAGQPLQESV